MCLGGSKKTTTTTPANAAVEPAVTNEVNAATSLASQPLQQYSGNLVAPLTDTQNQGISDIEGAQGLAQPYLTQAAQYATAGAAPITSTPFSASAVNQYESPYISDVLNTTEAAENQQDQQQQQSLAGNITAAGAWGGDRSAVVQSELAGQQALANNQTNANIENQGYGQALSQFNTQNQLGVQTQEANNQNAQATAYSLGNLGTSMENTALTGGSALLNAGTLQQQVNQENLNVPYEQYLQQQAYPYQQLDFESGILGSAAGTGGTSSTSTTSTPFGSQLLGGLTSLAGTIGGKTPGSKDGGRIRLAEGGASYVPLPVAPSLSSFIPSSTGQTHGLSVPGAGNGEGGSDGSGGNTGSSTQGNQIGSAIGKYIKANPAPISGAPPVTSSGDFLGGTGNSGFLGLSGTGGLGDDLGGAADYVGSGLSSAADTIGSGLSAAGDAIGEGAGAAADAVGSGIGAAGDAVGDGLVSLLALLKRGGRVHGGGLATGGRTKLADGGNDGSDIGSLLDSLYPGNGSTSPPATPAGASALSLADTPSVWRNQVTNYASPASDQSLASPAPSSTPVPTWDDGTPVANGPSQPSDADSWGGGLSRPARIIPPAYQATPDWRRALLTAGTAMMAANTGNGLQNVGVGLQAGVKDYYDQLDKDNHPDVDHSGPTTLVRYADGTTVDTGIPTEAAINASSMNAYRKANMDTISADRKAAIQERANAASEAVAERAAAAGQASQDRANALEVARINATAGRFGQPIPGNGFDPSTNKTVPGAYIVNGKTGDLEFHPGVALTQKPPAAPAPLNQNDALNQARHDYAAYQAQDKTNGGAGVVHNLDGSVADPNTWITGRAANYLSGKMQHAASGQPSNAAPNSAPSSSEIPARPANVPIGSLYSPSRHMWKDNSGKLYTSSGQPQ